MTTPASCKKLANLQSISQIVVHPPGHSVYWVAVALSHPDRVVRVLGLSETNQVTQDGDSLVDMSAALFTVNLEAHGDTLPGDLDAENTVTNCWKHLVAAGVVDALCRLVCELTMFLNVDAGHPTTPELLPLKLKQDMRSAYYVPLETLLFHAINIQEPLSTTDKTFIASLKNNWRAMMNRLWADPANSLRPELTHVKERAVLSHLVDCLLEADPSFISIITSPDDKTIPLITRHWSFSTTSFDLKATSSVLCALVSQKKSYPMLTGCSHLRPSTDLLFSLICKGADPVSPCKEKQAQAVVTSFTRTLVRADVQKGTAWNLNFCLLLVAVLHSEIGGREFLHTLRRSGPFWRSCFALVRRSITGNKSSTEKAHRIVLNVISLIADLSDERDDSEVQALFQVLMNEGLFDLLDEAIGRIVGILHVKEQLYRVLTSLAQIPSLSLELRESLGCQLPRPRTIAALLRYEQHISAGGNGKDLFYATSVWQAFAAMQNRFFDWSNKCARRGCLRKWIAICGSCRRVQYCSITCQKRDWPADHKLVCGYMDRIRAPFK